MKNKLTALALLAVGVAALAPQPAKANDAGAIIGGFIGGLIVGNAINDHHRAPPTTVVVERGSEPAYCPPPAPPPAGYWREVSVRRWVPERWECRYEYGREVRVLIPGFWTFDRERVWVPYERTAYRSYGYNHRRW